MKRKDILKILIMTTALGLSACKKDEEEPKQTLATIDVQDDNQMNNKETVNSTKESKETTAKATISPKEIDNNDKGFNTVYKDIIKDSFYQNNGINYKRFYVANIDSSILMPQDFTIQRLKDYQFVSFKGNKDYNKDVHIAMAKIPTVRKSPEVVQTEAKAFIHDNYFHLISEYPYTLKEYENNGLTLIKDKSQKVYVNREGFDYLESNKVMDSSRMSIEYKLIAMQERLNDFRLTSSIKQTAKPNIVINYIPKGDDLIILITSYYNNYKDVAEDIVDIAPRSLIYKDKDPVLIENIKDFKDLKVRGTDTVLKLPSGLNTIRNQNKKVIAKDFGLTPYDFLYMEKEINPNIKDINFVLNFKETKELFIDSKNLNVVPEDVKILGNLQSKYNKYYYTGPFSFLSYDPDIDSFEGYATITLDDKNVLRMYIYSGENIQLGQDILAKITNESDIN